MPTAARTKRAAEGEQGRTNTNQEEEMDWAKQEGSKHERGIQDCPNAGSAPSHRQGIWPFFPFLRFSYNMIVFSVTRRSRSDSGH